MKHRSLLVLFLTALLACTTATAQIGEARHTFSIGVAGGANLSSVGFDPSIKQKMLTAPAASFIVRITSEKYFKTLCALQGEINLVKMGWKEDIRSSADEPLPDTYERHLTYIQVPLFARLSWGRESGLMFVFMAGPQVGYCLSDTEQRGGTWTLNDKGNPDRPNDLYQQYGYKIDHKFDYGIIASLGLELNTRIGRFGLEGRYYYGLGDIYANGKKDVFGRSNNSSIAIRLSYLFDLHK